MNGWPDGPTPLMGRPCAGCWYARGNPAGLPPGRLELMTEDAQRRQLYVTCPLVRGAVCAGFYELFTTASLRMVHMLWGFTMVDPPNREEAAHGHHRAGRS